MKKVFFPIFFLLFFLTILTGCNSASEAPIFTLVPPTFTQIPPTFIPEPTITATPKFPGIEVIPISTLNANIPWLPWDYTKIPMVMYYCFNLSEAPFDNVLVRQSFASAIDRDALVKELLKRSPQFEEKEMRPATTITPPKILGRDLYNEVGVPFDPIKAKGLLAQAGYKDASLFPTIKIEGGGFSDMIAKMWEQHLGIKVNLAASKSGSFNQNMFAWFADYNDPDNFLRENFHSAQKSSVNCGFSNSNFDKLVDRASKSNDPAERQLLYIEAERILTEEETALIPLFSMDTSK